MKILVLGSGGFIGNHAVTILKQDGFTVYSADIAPLSKEHYFAIDPKLPDFGAIFQSESFDVCLNATGSANVQFSFQQPDIDFQLNTANVFKILDAIRLYNPSCKFINLSSAAVYGNPDTLPIHEGLPSRPISPYGWHKFYSEQVCKEYADYFGIASVSLRIFSAYGEGLKKQLLWDIYQKVKANDSEIELFGTGKETRDFIHVSDIILAIKAVIRNASFNGEVINVASGSACAIDSIANLLVAKLKPSVKVKFTSSVKVGDPSFWRADISKLNALGFTPKISIEEGINKYALWLEEKAF